VSDLPNTLTDEQHAARVAAWEAALYEGSVPEFVAERLTDAASGHAPWISTMTPAELLIAKTHGVRPIATVSGNCWMKISYGMNWFGLAQGHAEGWSTALARIQQEAIVAGADAVVDVRLATQGRDSGTGGVEFSVIGTAVKIGGMAKPEKPVLATVPALEFVRMVESGVVPTGVAIGAAGDLLSGMYGFFAAGNSYGSGFGNYGTRQQLGWQSASWFNQPLTELTDFWERIRREAISHLRDSAGRGGNGVLAHSHRSRLVRIERDKQPPDWAGEHIVIGTIVDASQYRNLGFEIATVTDLRDSSPLCSPFQAGNVYPQDEDMLHL
jgi:uncharacterized protein YbjQ (UPF0145 family)